MRKTLIFILFLMFLGADMISCPLSLRGADRTREFDSIPGPELSYPVTDNISLEGKDFLEFRWKRFNITRIDYFEFKLYKGYKTVESTLIFKQRFPGEMYPIRIPAGQFETNQVYTWSLRQAFMNGEKSDRSFSSFKIIK